ncbi:N-acetyltransferase [Mycolicibacterium insubricum]|jgi:ribosomal protein S18 acetylase RimI-like enzyme|uniref:GNAT family N-acetyltransferase n=1 Tax=Mycolicibacterium insubricum TaxID=444597 RepID=A0A1X0DJ05_9MYCO|nr:GNAT family N-acetyltransferase [Mycolicibacterium insubricum]MCB9441333.1 GNAT family N-acetyltransferase [Mycolicibacterium sp.]MCV7081734.1 GNAT family N-acetyltransferase [Mycolicibacterium insubricum]ORA72384.1 GNAT family N-acetyltransferase [Mycolicibacterium insubricum]BBZ67689.1 N-acetyltransferase [Mycolicibacterium insubricum]
MTFGKGVSNATRLYLVDLTSEELQARLIEALNVYVEAMGYPRGTEELRAWMWLDHARRPGWQAVGAVELDPAGADATPSPAQIAAGRLVGIGYGYRGAPDQWWQQQVAAGLRRSQVPEETVAALLNSYFELTELHIRPGAQGRGLGEALARRLLGRRPESNVLLSTPEIDAEDNRAWRLYRRLGFTDVIRGYRFPGDPRPFAVLGRSLPL